MTKIKRGLTAMIVAVSMSAMAGGDLEPPPDAAVPDGGSTFLLLVIGFAGIMFIREVIRPTKPRHT